MAAELAPEPHSISVTRQPSAVQRLWKLLNTRPRPHLATSLCRIVLELPQTIQIAAALRVRRFIGSFSLIVEAFTAAGAVAACWDWEGALKL
jgi:hypothetical protein